MLGDNPQDERLRPVASPITSTNEPLVAPFPDEQLHDTLLGIFRQRVDPLVRIMHWPTFLEHARAFRRRKLGQIHGSPGGQYTTSFFPDRPYNEIQQALYPPPTVQSQNPGPYPASASFSGDDASFTALLFSVYYAATVSVVDSPNPPDLGQNISVLSLASSFKSEVMNRAMSLNEGIARSGSLQMLQAMVLYLVSSIAIIIVYS